MGAWPLLLEGQRVVDMGALTASSTATVITAGTANTKGSWVQLVASTAFDFAMVILVAGNPSTSNAVDIGLGAAASEYVLLPNIMIRANATSGAGGKHLALPLSIPAGSRLAARSQSATASATIQISLLGVGA